MRDRDLIRATLRALARRLRLARACTVGSRLFAAGLVVALGPLLLKGLFPVAGPVAAFTMIVAGGAAGFLYGWLRPVDLAHVARLADRHLDLKERLTTAAEHLTDETPSDLHRAQLAETAARVREVGPKDAFPIRLTTEARLAGPLAVLALALTLLPPLPLRAPERTSDPTPPAASQEEEKREKPLAQRLAPPALPKELLPRGTEREVQRGPLSGRSPQGDQAAVFRDTKMSQQRPDFGSFIKQGDERLQLLARPENLPDLNRDFTQSPYQMRIRQMQNQLKSAGLQGLTWEQVERLLSELGQAQQRLGSGELPDDLMEELKNNRGSGPTDKLLSALSRALSRLRDRDEAAGGKGKNLREAPGGKQPGSGQGNGEGSEKGQEGGEPGGSLPGTEKSLQTRGDATPRIGTDKQDSTLEGDLRDGRMEAYDTNLSGRGAQNESRLPYLDVFSRYKKLMEEALTKEPIPFNYREQVKEYFKALEAR